MESVEQQFLFYLLQWDVEQINQAHGTGTTMIHVSKGSMESRLVPIPPLAIQARISAVLDSLFAETRRLQRLYEHKQASLVALKKSLRH